MRQYIEAQGYGHQAKRYRLAAYAVWYATPAELRPVRFQRDLAHLLGMAKDDNFREWRTAYPDLFSDDTVRQSIKQLIMENMPDVIMASIQCATDAGEKGFADRQMLAKIAGVLTQASSTIISGETTVNLRNATDLTDDELAAIATGRRG